MSLIFPHFHPLDIFSMFISFISMCPAVFACLHILLFLPIYSPVFPYVFSCVCQCLVLERCLANRPGDIVQAFDLLLYYYFYLYFRPSSLPHLSHIVATSLCITQPYLPLFSLYRIEGGIITTITNNRKCVNTGCKVGATREPAAIFFMRIPKAAEPQLLPHR